ncbi:hypothetical protein [Cumulibacter soli]|uniref:hypothetical protein n=1 Tax=Cumulibacter soli TaxID=2546344 RepID=UPI0010687B60|nr:hypothetical protein [Cumulibacter soli]
MSDPGRNADSASSNPYTDAAPLHVTEHPWRANRSLLVLALIVAVAPLVWLLGRLLLGASPLVPAPLVVALAVGEPLGVLIAVFPLLLASGISVTLGADSLTRKIRRGMTRTIRLDDIRAGIYASNVGYRVDGGAELILFLGGEDVLWIADGIEPDDIRLLAEALADRGIQQYDEHITTEQLAALVRKARRVGLDEG